MSGVGVVFVNSEIDLTIAHLSNVKVDNTCSTTQAGDFVRKRLWYVF